jgi:hypothetical protein
MPARPIRQQAPNLFAAAAATTAFTKEKPSDTAGSSSHTVQKVHVSAQKTAMHKCPSLSPKPSSIPPAQAILSAPDL